MTDPTRRGCVVLTIRAAREDVCILTPEGEILIEIEPINKNRSRVVVRAPVSLRVERRSKEVTP